MEILLFNFSQLLPLFNIALVANSELVIAVFLVVLGDFIDIVSSIKVMISSAQNQAWCIE